MKVHTTITLDEELLDKARKKGINLSSTINDLLSDSLAPKKMNKKEEDELDLIIKIAEEFELPKDEIKRIYETLDLGTVGLWESFQRQFEPGYDLWRFIEIRKEIRELLTKSHGEKE